MPHYGKLFVFEGADRSGKTTVSRSFAEHANAVGFECDWFSFPGRETGTLGKHVYDIHHDPLAAGIKKTINPTSLQLLHVAAHASTLSRASHGYARLSKRDTMSFWTGIGGPLSFYGVVAGAKKQSLKARWVKR